MFRYDPRRPYITCESEQELYDYGKKRKEPIKDELKLNYNRVKESNKHFVIRDVHYENFLTFEEVATWICNEALPAIAGEGVYYLMNFISLGALAVEFNENTDFIKIELSYIFENKLLEKMKVRINCESYIDMEQESENIKQHFLLFFVQKYSKKYYRQRLDFIVFLNGFWYEKEEFKYDQEDSCQVDYYYAADRSNYFNYS